MRRAELRRATSETEIALALDLDGTGKADVWTGIAFFDHMLTAFARHGRFDLTVEAAGDLAVDAHHTVEDVGIVLGDALKQALGEGRGIRRFGFAAVPMDEALAEVAIDCGGRAYLVFDAPFSGQTVGGIDVTLVRHFLESVCQHGGLHAPRRARTGGTTTTWPRPSSRPSVSRCGAPWRWSPGTSASRRRKACSKKRVGLGGLGREARRPLP